MCQENSGVPFGMLENEQQVLRPSFTYEWGRHIGVTPEYHFFNDRDPTFSVVLFVSTENHS